MSPEKTVSIDSSGMTIKVDEPLDAKNKENLSEISTPE